MFVSQIRMSLTAVFANPLFANLVEALKDLVGEVTLVCEPDGMSLNSMDSAHVALVCMKLPKTFFVSYSCVQPMVMGLSLVTLSKIAKSSAFHTKAGVVRLTSSKGDDVCLIEAFETENMTTSQKNVFELCLMDIDDEGLTCPQYDRGVRVTIPHDQFAAIVTDLKEMGDSINIRIEEGGEISFNTRSEVGSATIKRVFVCEGNDSIEQSFALKYFSMFAKAKSMSREVVMSLTKEFPIELRFGLPGEGELCFYLAPKVMDDQVEQPNKKQKMES